MNKKEIKTFFDRILYPNKNRRVTSKPKSDIIREAAISSGAESYVEFPLFCKTCDSGEPGDTIPESEMSQFRISARCSKCGEVLRVYKGLNVSGSKDLRLCIKPCQKCIMGMGSTGEERFNRAVNDKALKLLKDAAQKTNIKFEEVTPQNDDN
jgi:hypothetical protein